MNKNNVIDLIKSDKPLKDIIVMGWIRTRRSSKDFSFIEVNDGSCLKNIQIIIENTIENYEDIKKITTGSAVSVKGNLVKSPGKNQAWEIQALDVEILSISPESYPLQKKRHTDEYLRSIAHLRPRTNKYGAIFRIRSEVSYAVHKFFRDKNFKYIHTPIITGSDCEGAGEMFKIKTLNPEKNDNKENKNSYSSDFFGKEANLTVSGQLSAEMFCLALGNVYTFGPTFRAENSNTSRHISEFWMIEPEMAFCDIYDNMKLSEEFIKFLINFSFENCMDDLELFNMYVDKGLFKTLKNILNSDFIKITYEEAVKILIKSGNTFDYKIEYGKDLQSEHERYLTESHFKQPVIVYNYPKKIKPFYMRLNPDNETVAAMDVLVPRIGELIGGSQREERIDILEKRMDETGLNKEEYWWYLDSRKYGSVIHSGFGLGFERLLMLISGITNIRDVIPFPRTPKNLDF